MMNLNQTMSLSIEELPRDVVWNVPSHVSKPSFALVSSSVILMELSNQPPKEIHQSDKLLWTTPTPIHMAVLERVASRRKRVANRNPSHQ